jgi:hypothetical protein
LYYTVLFMFIRCYHYSVRIPITQSYNGFQIFNIIYTKNQNIMPLTYHCISIFLLSYILLTYLSLKYFIHDVMSTVSDRMEFRELDVPRPGYKLTSQISYFWSLSLKKSVKEFPKISRRLDEDTYIPNMMKIQRLTFANMSYSVVRSPVNS